MTASRAGEKLGWPGGWAGGFLWVLALAILFLLRGSLSTGRWGLPSPDWAMGPSSYLDHGVTRIRAIGGFWSCLTS